MHARRRIHACALGHRCRHCPQVSAYDIFYFFIFIYHKSVPRILVFTIQNSPDKKLCISIFTA
jgi:hypothetical protein